MTELKQVMIRRYKHDRENPYVQVSRAMLRDKNLTPKDKGILTFILSNREDWIVRLEHLAFELNVGRDYIRSSITNLKKFGYCRYYKEKNEKGQYFSGGYEFSEYPVFFETNKNNDKKIDETSPEIQKMFPETAFPPQEVPTPEVPTLISNSPNEKQDNKKKEKNIKKEKVKFRDTVELTQEEYDKLLADVGKDNLDKMLDCLDSYKEAHGKTYESDYAVMKRGGWVRYKLDSLSIATKSNNNSANEYALQIQKEYYSPYCEIEVSHNSIYFIPTQGAAAHPTIIKLDDNGFKDQVRNLLDKKGFKKKKIAENK